MHSKLFLVSALLSITSTASAATITAQTINPSQVSHISADVSSYISTLVLQPQFSSVVSVIASAADAASATITGDPTIFVVELFASLVTETAVPTDLGLPSDVMSYVSSVREAEVSIVNKDTGNGATSADTVSIASTAAPTAIGSSTMASSTVSSMASSMAPPMASSMAGSTGTSTPSAAAPATTTSKAAAPSAVAVKAAGVLIAAGAMGIALL